MSDLTTLRDIVGLGNQASPISDSALVIIDAQNTYREGVMKLDGVEPELQECKALLERFRRCLLPGGLYAAKNEFGFEKRLLTK